MSWEERAEANEKPRFTVQQAFDWLSVKQEKGVVITEKISWLKLQPNLIGDYQKMYLFIIVFRVARYFAKSKGFLLVFWLLIKIVDNFWNISRAPLTLSDRLRFLLQIKIVTSLEMVSGVALIYKFSTWNFPAQNMIRTCWEHVASINCF